MIVKGLFALALLLVAVFGALLALNVGVRWTEDMFYTQRVMPGEMVFPMPSGSIPRSGGELTYAKEEREAAAARKNPVPATAESVRKGGELFTIYCTPCHGASGKGDGLVAAKFAPAADLTNADLQKVRTDGFWQSYMSVGGAVMPSYGEALSVNERWDIVNYLRTLGKQ